MMISLKNVKKSFNDHHILQDISFTLDKGERVSLLGPGGCGKSTILKIILGILLPDQGEVVLRHTDMFHASDDKKQETLRKVGMAFQQGALFDYMTVEENLKFAMEHMTDLRLREMDERIQELLDGVKLGRTRNMFPYELSGGMQRRVGIARALCTDPEVAIFDEPTSGLDPVTSTIILNMILDMGGKNPNKACLIATSSTEIAIRFADRVILINEGKVAAEGDWHELLISGPEWVRHFLSVRLIGLDIGYAHELGLPREFMQQHY